MAKKNKEMLAETLQYLEGFVNRYSIKGLHKAITNHEHVKNSAKIAANLVNKLKDPSGVRVSNPRMA